ncbi:unnamed protein product, partial [Didymodactylos carnosus]
TLNHIPSEIQCFRSASSLHLEDGIKCLNQLKNVKQFYDTLISLEEIISDEKSDNYYYSKLIPSAHLTVDQLWELNDKLTLMINESKNKILNFCEIQTIKCVFLQIIIELRIKLRMMVTIYHLKQLTCKKTIFSVQSKITTSMLIHDYKYNKKSSSNFYNDIINFINFNFDTKKDRKLIEKRFQLSINPLNYYTTLIDYQSVFKPYQLSNFKANRLLSTLMIKEYLPKSFKSNDIYFKIYRKLFTSFDKFIMKLKAFIDRILDLILNELRDKRCIHLRATLCGSSSEKTNILYVDKDESNMITIDYDYQLTLMNFNNEESFIKVIDNLMRQCSWNGQVSFRTIFQLLTIIDTIIQETMDKQKIYIYNLLQTSELYIETIDTDDSCFKIILRQISKTNSEDLCQKVYSFTINIDFKISLPLYNNMQLNELRNLFQQTNYEQCLLYRAFINYGLFSFNSDILNSIFTFKTLTCLHQSISNTSVPIIELVQKKLVNSFVEDQELETTLSNYIFFRDCNTRIKYKIKISYAIKIDQIMNEMSIYYKCAYRLFKYFYFVLFQHEHYSHNSSMIDDLTQLEYLDLEENITEYNHDDIDVTVYKIKNIVIELYLKYPNNQNIHHILRTILKRLYEVKCKSFHLWSSINKYDLIYINHNKLINLYCQSERNNTPFKWSNITKIKLLTKIIQEQ